MYSPLSVGQIEPYVTPIRCYLWEMHPDDRPILVEIARVLARRETVGDSASSQRARSAG